MNARLFWKALVVQALVVAVPFAILGLVVLVPLAVGASNWHRARKAEREYRASATANAGQSSSSSPS